MPSLTLSRAEGPPKVETEEGRGLKSGNLEAEMGAGVGRGGQSQRGAAQLNPGEYLVSRLADIGPIPSDAPLEESRAAIAGIDPVVLPGASVTTHFARNI